MSREGEPMASEHDLYREATELVVKCQFASRSMVQRQLRVGFVKAGQLLDHLTDRGIVGPPIGAAKPRDVRYPADQLQDALDALVVRDGE